MLKKKTNILIESMHGIGDQIYQRPFIKNLVTQGNKVYIRTHLPSIYKDIKGLMFVKPIGDTYRTQSKNSEIVKYSELPNEYSTIDPLYNGNTIVDTSIVNSMKEKFSKFGDMENLSWTLPSFNTDLSDIVQKTQGKPIAIIRPGTIRNEWKVYTRNADARYINWCAKVLKEFGYYTISIADVDDLNEFLVGDIPQVDLVLHKGELGLYGTLDLIQISEIVVGGSGFIVPATVSSNSKLFVIFGGRMAYDSPYKILHPSMNMKKIGWAMPKNPCRCTQTKHECDKSIPDIDHQFMNFFARTT